MARRQNNRSGSGPVSRASLLAVALLATGLLAPLLGLAGPAGAQQQRLCDGRVPTLIVPPGGARFDGTDGDDVILGTIGADEIHGHAGDDVICGLRGEDRIFGGPGHDRLHGNWGSDWIEGGSGNDRLYGGRHHDFLFGNPGSDSLYGFWGRDELNGQLGNDRLWGGRHDDILRGGDGNDDLYGGWGRDECGQGPGTGFIAKGCDRRIVEPTPEPTPVAPDPGSPGCGNQSGPLNTTVRRTFTSETRIREYRFVLPPGYDPVTPTPVVYAFHGFKGNGLLHLDFTEGREFASRFGAIIVAPTGLPAAGQSETRWELSGSEDPARDDLVFFDDLVAEIEASFCVDQTRRYVNGFSNGGWFVSRLVCERAADIAGAGSVAALSHFAGCDPSRPVPYLGFHGTADPTVPYSGGSSNLGPTDFPAALVQEIIPQEVDGFAIDFGCSIPAAVVAVSTEVDRLSYSCPSTTEVFLYRHNGGGHTWPGSLVSQFNSNQFPVKLGATTMTIDANELMWQMFSRHSLAAS